MNSKKTDIIDLTFSRKRQDFLRKLTKEKRLSSDMYLLSKQEFDMRLDIMMLQDERDEARLSAAVKKLLEYND